MSGKVEINGWPVCYEKFGNGPEVLLFIPGAIGISIIAFHIKYSII